MTKSKRYDPLVGDSSSFAVGFVRRFMRDLGLTQFQMAQMFNVSERQIPRWLSAEASPGPAHIAKMREMVQDPRLPIITDRARAKARIERSPVVCFAIGADNKLRATSRLFDEKARDYYGDAYAGEGFEPLQSEALDHIFHYLDLTTEFQIPLFGEARDVTCILLRPNGREVWGLVEVIPENPNLTGPVTPA